MPVPTESKVEERGLERLIFFSDAVVAIAITLLVLPLTELKPAEGQGAWEFLGEHSYELLAFAISFLVIARFWFIHHALFGKLVRMDLRLMLLNMAWLASLVLLPFPTALLEDEGGYATLYLVNLLATSVLTTTLGFYIRHHPELVEVPEAPAAGHDDRVVALILIGSIGAALVASVFWQSGAMLVLLIIPIAQRIVNGVTGRHSTRAGAH